MRAVCLALVLVTLVGCAPAASAVPPALDPRVADEGTAVEVRTEMVHAWQAYRRHAWGHDELRPDSRTADDWHDGAPLLLTPVDALDTLLLMRLDDEAAAARRLIGTGLDLDRDVYVSVFETTIRLLGGLLSGYQMTRDQQLLDLAADLGRRLAPAFDSPTGMPYPSINLRTGDTRGSRSNPAEIGTLILEFGTLAELTRQPRYRDLARRALIALWQRRSPLGLVGSRIDVNTGRWLDRSAHISGGIDSYYEYLVKGARLFGDEELARMAQESVTAVDRHLADERPDGLWFGQADMSTGWRTRTVFGALDGFYPAVLVLAGDVPRAARLQDSAWRMWQVAGLPPERYDYQRQQIVNGGYPLRPEIAESAYYLWQRTHDPRYREMGKQMLRDLRRWCRVSDGYVAIRDVRTKAHDDIMPSYFLAETLKYLYLLFAGDDALPLDDIVLNTEAHPLRRTW